MDLFKNASLLTQFIQIVSFFIGATFVVFICGEYKTINDSLLNYQLIYHFNVDVFTNDVKWHSKVSDRFQPICLQFQNQIDSFLSKFISTSQSVDSNHSPKKKQRLLQAEIEKYVQAILHNYVRHWSRSFSELDEEIENDLRRILSNFMDKVKNLDGEKYLKDVLVILCHHMKRVKVFKVDGVQFRYRHPVSLNKLTLDSYLSLWTETLLIRFDTEKTVSSHTVFRALVQILSEQIFKKVLLTYSDPNCLRQLILNEKGQNGQEQIEEQIKRTVLEPKSKTVSDTQRLWASVDNAPSSPEGNPDYDRSISADTALTKKSGKWKRTLDLTGYKHREDAPVTVPNLITPSGKISTALGGLFSATAGPLLPDNIAFKSFNKMWRSHSSEEFQVDSPMRRRFSSSDNSSPEKSPVKSTKSKLLQKMPSFDLEDIVQQIEIPKLGAIYKDKMRRHSITSSTDLSNEIANDLSDALERRKTLSKPLVLRPSLDAEEEFSPNYEDTSDLESTISKLRALLNEKGSSNEKSENSSKDGSFEKSGRHVLDADSLPPDGRLILNVRIDPIESTEADNNTPISYRIQYDGIYLEPNVNTDNVTGSSFSYVLQPRKVIRTFKEFLNLQMRLEDNAKFKTAMKTMKGPNKMLHQPYSMSKTNADLEARRAFLEKWLIELCEHSEIAIGKELKSFLAYGDDGSIAFARRGETENKKIDKVITY